MSFVYGRPKFFVWQEPNSNTVTYSLFVLATFEHILTLLIKHFLYDGPLAGADSPTGGPHFRRRALRFHRPALSHRYINRILLRLQALGRNSGHGLGRHEEEPGGPWTNEIKQPPQQQHAEIIRLFIQIHPKCAA